MSLHISNLRVHLQEEGCICSYSTVRFKCSSISSLVCYRFCSRKVPNHNNIYDRLPADGLSVSKYEDVIIKD